MKKLIIISISSLLFAAAMSSCSGGYTCPTYAQQDDGAIVKTEIDERI